MLLATPPAKLQPFLSR